MARGQRLRLVPSAPLTHASYSKGPGVGNAILRAVLCLVQGWLQAQKPPDQNLGLCLGRPNLELRLTAATVGAVPDHRVKVDSGTLA